MIALCCFYIFNSTGNTYAQKRVVTEEGEVILLKDDGSWEYGKEGIDTISMEGCRYALNISEPINGNRLKIIEKSVFISFTSDGQFRESHWRDFTICEVALCRSNDSILAYFEFSFQTPQGEYFYGIIQKGRELLVKLENGKTLALEFAIDAKGTVDLHTNRTFFRSYAILNEEHILAFRESASLEVLMPWTKGKKKYPIAYTNLFRDQLECLK